MRGKCGKWSKNDVEVIVQIESRMLGWRLNSSTAASVSSSSKMIGSRSGLFWRGKYLEEGAHAGGV